jgi:hypothetical protein
MNQVALWANATSWQHPLDQRQAMWAAWFVLSFAVAAACTIVLCAIIFSRSARANAFNLYIAALMLPEVIFGFCCGLTCAMNIAHQGYLSDKHCEWQSFYVIFAFAASPWMNACIAREMHRLLSRTAALLPYQPLSVRHVLLQTVAVYLWCGCIASFTLWGVLPHKEVAVHGLNCLPFAVSLESSLFFWLLFVPAFIGIPTLYIIYVAVNSSRRNLISFRRRKRIGVHLSSKSLDDTSRATSRRLARTVTLFFARIFIVYCAMWIPALACIYLYRGGSPWPTWIGGAWSHLQGIVSAVLVLSKPDVREAVIALLTCYRKRKGSFEYGVPEAPGTWPIRIAQVMKMVQVAASFRAVSARSAATSAALASARTSQRDRRSGHGIGRVSARSSTRSDGSATSTSKGGPQLDASVRSIRSDASCQNDSVPDQPGASSAEHVCGISSAVAAPRAPLELESELDILPTVEEERTVPKRQHTVKFNLA